MPDLANILLSSSVTHCPTIKSLNDSSDSLPPPIASASDHKLIFPIQQDAHACKRLKPAGPPKKLPNGKALEDHVRAWFDKKTEMGLPKSRCYLPFLVGAPKMDECLVCHDFIYPGEEVLCAVRDCKGVYHSRCVKEMLGVSNVQKKFKCPQHVCFICKQRLHWRCVRCTIASHDKCAPWPNEVIRLKDQPGQAVCWRHPTDWRLDKKHSVPESKIEEIFARLPLPYVDEEFKLNFTAKDMESKLEQPCYVHIRRNVYLVKRKRDNADDGIGCTGCSTVCSENCVCRVQCISCSKACRCSEACTNRPFRKEKKIRIVKTEHCGWGVVAAEPIRKGDFIIEYIGEVIDDALCEKRLWDMKYRGVKNFYMCEIRKDFTIDATFKGNASRFLNHSCDPNCILEKWQVEGETRVGVFAAQSIKDGEPLTYDYRFVQFGPEVRCHCGAASCQGYLGTKKKICKVDLCWGVKRKRTSAACLPIMTL